LVDSGSDWVFPFDFSQQIFETLRLQLSYLFMDALALRLQLSPGGLLPRFRDLPGAQLRLIIERPLCWEYLLFSEVLTHEIAALADIKRDWHYRIAVGRSTRMTPRSFSEWSQTKTHQVLLLLANVNQIVDEALPQAFGPPGTSGDAEAILYCAKRLAEVYKSAMEWRVDFVRVEVPKELDRIKEATARLCDNMVQEIEEFSLKVNRDLKQAVVEAQSGKKVTLNFMLTLTSSGFAEFENEMQQMKALIADGKLAWD
jgi:hypothetical protein